jgi:predicted nucleic acid-binding protein
MLVYIDSSVLVRAYLPDEKGHDDARALLDGVEHLLVTATWTVVEVTSALARAARGLRVEDLDAVLAVLAADTGDDGPVTLLRGDVGQVERVSTRIVKDHAIRSLDALHLAVAQLAAVPLLDPGEPLGFATRDDAQAVAAEALGFVPL